MCKMSKSEGASGWLLNNIEDRLTVCTYVQFKLLSNESRRNLLGVPIPNLLTIHIYIATILNKILRESTSSR